MKHMMLVCVLLSGCSQLQLDQAASFLKELDKTVAAQKGGTSPSSSSNAYSPTQSSSTSTSSTSSATTSRTSPSSYNSSTSSYSPSSSSSSNSYSGANSYNSSSSSSSSSNQTRTVPTAMGCVRATRPAGKQWAELHNTCSFPIEVSWCYAGTSDCRNGTWGTTSSGTIRAGGSRSAGTFISQAGRYTVFYIACQGANTSAIETSATTFYCKP